ncbi:MAG: DUF2147 domain-containing protein [Bacteroidota bacterium]
MLLLLTLFILSQFFGIGTGPDTETDKEADDIIGVFLTEDSAGKIEFYRRDGRYYGKVVAGERITKDVNNPDPALRERSTLGMEFIQNFEYDADEGVYQGGTIYNSQNGKTYDGKIWLEDEGRTLKLRGYLGVFYRTVTWKRLEV